VQGSHVVKSTQRIRSSVCLWRRQRKLQNANPYCCEQRASPLGPGSPKMWGPCKHRSGIKTLLPSPDCHKLPPQLFQTAAPTLFPCPQPHLELDVHIKEGPLHEEYPGGRVAADAPLDSCKRPLSRRQDGLRKAGRWGPAAVSGSGAAATQPALMASQAEPWRLRTHCTFGLEHTPSWCACSLASDLHNERAGWSRAPPPTLYMMPL
jgi:hypothetical protein